MDEPLRQSMYRIYAVMAEFETPERLIAAARRAREAGYSKMEAYSPVPLDGLPEALALPRSKVPMAVLLGGIVGAVTAYGIQFLSTVIDYPHNIGGRPYHSWPSYIPVTFELTVLFASLVGLVAMILFNRLPRPHHPVFGDPRFTRATRDRFFLSIAARDPRFDLEQTRDFLAAQGALSVDEVRDDRLPGDVEE